MYEVITVGSSTVDAFVHTELHEVKKGKQELIAYPIGSKLLIRKLDFLIGGGGTNTAVSLARLRNKVAYLGEVGNDENARRILELLKKERVVPVVIKSKAHQSGYSVVLDSCEHNRTILTYKGANDFLKFSEIPLSKLKTKWFYFSSMLGESFKAQERLAHFAKKNKIKVAYNPSYYQIKDDKKCLESILKCLDLLIFNKEEAELLVGKDGINKLLKKVYGLGPKIVCITDGKNGAYSYDGEYMYSIGVHNIKVVERTGAGDAFASSFLAGLIKGKDIEYCMQLGIANSESVIRYMGAKNKLLKWNEIVKVIKKNPCRLKKVKI